jgi:hypothetical protein
MDNKEEREKLQPVVEMVDRAKSRNHFADYGSGHIYRTRVIEEWRRGW